VRRLCKEFEKEDRKYFKGAYTTDNIITVIILCLHCPQNRFRFIIIIFNPLPLTLLCQCYIIIIVLFYKIIMTPCNNIITMRSASPSDLSNRIRFLHLITRWSASIYKKKKKVVRFIHQTSTYYYYDMIIYTIDGYTLTYNTVKNHQWCCKISVSTENRIKKK